MISGTHPPQIFGKPTDPQTSHPHRGGGGLLDTHPPATIGKMPYRRQNALASTFGADPKSPTMTNPPPHPRRVGHTLRKTVLRAQAKLVRQWQLL